MKNNKWNKDAILVYSLLLIGAWVMFIATTQVILDLLNIK